MRLDTWTEEWQDKAGNLQTIEVTAEVWTEAFQADLDADGKLHIPAHEKPCYLDGPLVMNSGQKLTAEAKAEIRLKPGTSTCMVRNQSVATLNTKAVPADQPLDTNIRIEGGIWSALAVTRADSNGNVRGASSKQNAAFGNRVARGQQDDVVRLEHRARRTSIRASRMSSAHPTATNCAASCARTAAAARASSCAAATKASPGAKPSTPRGA